MFSHMFKHFDFYMSIEELWDHVALVKWYNKAWILEFGKKTNKTKPNNKAGWNNLSYSCFLNYLLSIQFKIQICVYQRVTSRSGKQGIYIRDIPMQTVV